MLRVMIADDEPIMRKALLSLVNWEDLECEIVYSVVNGEDVIAHLKDSRPDILITDIKMPGKDGIEISKYVFENKLPVKVVILTAYADFSYAQSALKYNVVDYVTKTGALDGLEQAVKKCRNMIEAEKKKQGGQNEEVMEENFFKAVIDGSLYDIVEMKQRMDHLTISLSSYFVALLHFRMAEKMEAAQRKRIHKSLLNFFQMAFSDNLLTGFFIHRDIFFAVLNRTGMESVQMIQKKCDEIIDMMDNFMKLNVYVGLSESVNGVEMLKEAYDQADSVLGDCFFDEKRKVNFYRESASQGEVYLPAADSLMDKIYHAAAKGEGREAVNYFREAFSIQKEAGYSAASIKNTGVGIVNRCRKILMEYDTDIQDVMKGETRLTNRILTCLHAAEFKELIEEVLTASAGYVSQMGNRKNALIIDCLNYIDEHFEENISVAEISESIGTSPSYLSRIFKETTGNTIIYTLNQKKLEKAKEYLLENRLKIYEIADKLGFENTTYFSHFFKKYTGCAPKDFRK